MPNSSTRFISRSEEETIKPIAMSEDLSSKFHSLSVYITKDLRHDPNLYSETDVQVIRKQCPWTFNSTYV